MREGAVVVRDEQAAMALVGTGQVDERRGPVVGRVRGAARVGVVQARDLPPVDEELDEVAEAAEAVPLLCGHDSSRGLVAAQDTPGAAGLPATVGA